jgi:hypothetical protein
VVLAPSSGHYDLEMYGMTVCRDDPWDTPTKKTWAEECPSMHFPFGNLNHQKSFKIHTKSRISCKDFQRTLIAKMSLSNKLSITDVDLKGKRVLIRVSYLQCWSRTKEIALTTPLNATGRFQRPP